VSAEAGLVFGGRAAGIVMVIVIVVITASV
jgi:hypothetical protein